MDKFYYINFLGMQWGESGMQPLVDYLKIIKAPKISKGDRTGHSLFKKFGVELTFKDEQFINIPGRVFPEGAMVLCNIRFYLQDGDGYKTYKGKLPDGISLPFTKNNAFKLFGVPNFPKYSAAGELLSGEDDWMMRWDRPKHLIFCSFDDEDRATEFGIQLPLDQA